MTTEAPIKKHTLLKSLAPIAVILIAVMLGLGLIKKFVVGPPRLGTATADLDLKVGGTIPDFTLNKFGDHASVQASTLSSKVVLVNFWASWCEACMVEMPSIVKLRESFKAKGFEVVSVNVDENPEKAVPPLTKKFKMEFPVYVDTDQKLSELFDIHAIPLTVIMDKNRKILFMDSGERDWDGSDMIKMLDGWLAG